jgi:multicomponent Na+:H+ antiporter subunit D
MNETFTSVWPVIAVLAPLGGAALVALSGRWPNLRDSWSSLAALVMLAAALVMLTNVMDERIPQATLVELSPSIELTLRADPAGIIFALLASFLWVAAGVYAVGYMRAENESNQTRFFTAFAISLGAAMGVALAANLLTFVLFYELLTLSTYPLVVHRQTDEALAAGRKYLTYTLSGGLLLIGGTAWLAALGIDTSFIAGGFLADEGLSKGTLWGLFAMLIVGVGVKSAVMPLHGWLPSAMVAPTPVSALLHAVAVVKAGAFGMVRMVIFVFGPIVLREIDAWQVLAGFAGATIIIASTLALRHDNLKRRLAYSTISHLSYIVLGLALLGPLAMAGALLHLVGHGVTKITLFFVAGAIHAHTHKENVSELDGIGRQMPITMGAFTLASLSMAGIPPFVLFASKFYLGAGAVQVEQHAYLVLYLVAGVLSAAYLFPIIMRAFFRPLPEPESGHEGGHGEPNIRMVVPLAVTGVLALVWGIFPNFPFKFFELVLAATNSVTYPGGGFGG